MIQKIRWILCFSFGTVLLVNCDSKPVEPISSAEYVYINKMNTQITIIAHDYDSYKAKIIQSGDSLTLLTDGDISTLPFYRNILADQADSVTIQFSDGKCTTYRRGNGMPDGVLDHKKYDNYSLNLVSKKFFRLSYSIDSTDYNKAVPCK